MAHLDVYEVIDRQTLAGQEVLNVYFFINNEVLSARVAQDLIDKFLTDYMPDILSSQTGDCLHTEISARNLFNATDRAVNAISLSSGGVATDYQNTFSAIGFSLVQDNGAVKNGSKRIAAVPDQYVTDGVVTDAGYVTILNNLAATLASSLMFGIVETFVPIVVKRILTLPGIYRLPENYAETVWGRITDAVFNPSVTSQTSRKIGRGI